MALRAGYYGIKNALLKKLQGLTDALVIKSIGEGLDLSAAGELSNTSIGGVDYSTTEQNTGLKWYDGKDIYCKTFTADCSGNISTSVSLADVNFESLVKAEGVVKITPLTGNVYFDKLDQTHLNNQGNNLDYVYASGLMSITPNSSMLIRIGANLADDRYVTAVTAVVTLYYTKATATANRSTKKK